MHAGIHNVTESGEEGWCFDVVLSLRSTPVVPTGRSRAGPYTPPLRPAAIGGWRGRVGTQDFEPPRGAGGAVGRLVPPLPALQWGALDLVLGIGLEQRTCQ